MSSLYSNKGVSWRRSPSPDDPWNLLLNAKKVLSPSITYNKKHVSHQRTSIFINVHQCTTSIFITVLIERSSSCTGGRSPAGHDATCALGLAWPGQAVFIIALQTCACLDRCWIIGESALSDAACRTLSRSQVCFSNNNSPSTCR